MNTSNESRLTCKQKLLSALEKSDVRIKTSGTEEAIEIMNRISDWLEISLHPTRYEDWCRFQTMSDVTKTTVYLTLTCIESQTQKFLDFYFSTNTRLEENCEYTADEIEKIINGDDEIINIKSPSMKLLREFSTTYGVELSITPEGWLVVDGTNEAVLTDVELVRYMTAYESIKDIMLKFER